MANRDKFGLDVPIVRSGYVSLSKPIVCRVGPDHGMGSCDRRYFLCKNTFLSVFLFCLVGFNLAFLLRGLVKPTEGLLGKICKEQLKNQQAYLNSQPMDTIHIALFSKYAYRNMKIVRGIDKTIGSILKYTENPLHLHVLLDLPSKNRVARVLKKVSKQYKKKLKVDYYDVHRMADQFRNNIKTMRRYFFSKDVGRYNDDIFFMTQIFHLSLPKHLDKLIFLDIDLKFVSDIRGLHQQFDKFHQSNVIGLAPDLQPQYRVDFGRYRSKNSKTWVGSPRPGRQGFNTGVTLFSLERMRNSSLYNSLLERDSIDKLCHKYDFHGYLGHQDFYTLTGMEYPELYYDLDCTWNRQLDTGWGQVIEPQVFDLYHTCDGKVKVYHGNGNSYIPKD